MFLMKKKTTLKLPGGGKYVGEVKDGDPHGQGTLTYAEGDKYIGKWKDGKRHGKGTYTEVDGKKYVGEWNDGKWKDGKIHEQKTRTVSESKFKKYVVRFVIVIIVIGGFQYFQLRTSVKETIQRMLTENTNVNYAIEDCISSCIEGINLPIALILAKKVSADVFLRKSLLGDTIRIEVLVIPKNATPILSILFGMNCMVEISGIEMLRLRNHQ